MLYIHLIQRIQISGVFCRIIFDFCRQIFPYRRIIVTEKFIQALGNALLTKHCVISARSYSDDQAIQSTFFLNVVSFVVLRVLSDPFLNDWSQRSPPRLLQRKSQ